MSYANLEESSGQRASGFLIAVVLHFLIGYALVNGLARKIIEVVQAPLETKIIEELKPPPPVEKPPLPQLPKFAAPPPPYIPAPEVRIDVPVVSASTISAVSSNRPAAEAPIPRPNVPVASGPARTPAVVDPSACTRPEYPPASLREGDEGTVVLMFLIGTNGVAVESRIEKSSGYKRLDEAARRALALCRFKPGTEDGKPVQSWARIDYKWQIQDAQ